MRITIVCWMLLWAPVAPAAGDTLGVVSSKPTEGPYVEIDGGYMVPYEFTIPGTTAKLAMAPIPGGTHVMGAGDAAYSVTIEPFWMARTETNWEQYQAFMRLYDLFQKFEESGVRRVTDRNKIDAVTTPTPLCSRRIAFENGEDPQQAAVTMTQYAAMQFSKWISGVTGQQYRLPSEAEWEHAALGGAAGPYALADADKLEDYAWYSANADEMQHKVGEKLPNRYGLYDVHGNVSEWVLDAYVEQPPVELAGKTFTVAAAIQWSDKPFPLCLKGGSWDDDPEACKITAKLGSNDDVWKNFDPNLPRSPWWFTNYPATCVGFRVIRPLRTLPSAEMARYWEPSAEETKLDIAERLKNRRGVSGLVDQQLPAAIEQAEKK
ncbi:formylglycine-generating enzyme family protein [Blastopirellula marina]|uniref:Transcriptional regulator n=1 Tax=Blastopirellula marina TaxID=124 RepID=A0A2S8GG41_9BACT|nr:SUMF1/EgtB/PvdO family nonheme iron enzyme [Blastopirellula marina]PQO43435.1 transcriptional regulator [Blastopirellula marina]PTL46749.1 transcriptional regulator [Blastopirellula marina]